MIKTFIPSCNRACQLHLLLSSLEKNAHGLFDCTISYNATNYDYLKGYNKLINSPLGRKHTWIDQNLGKDYYYFLHENHDDIICHLVDDCIFYAETDITEKEIRQLFGDEGLFSFSWRVGFNVVRDGHKNNARTVPLPESLHTVNGSFLVWNYTHYSHPSQSYFAFECALDGYIYRANDLVWIFGENKWESITEPGWFEHHLENSPRRKMHNRNLMMSPLHSKVFSNHINVTHNRPLDGDGFSMQTDVLNNMYLDGWQIDMETMDFSLVDSGHKQIPFTLKKS